MNEHREHEHSTACMRDECPYQETIGSLNKTVFIGNGTPALTVQISNLAAKMDTTRNLVLAAFGAIPAIVLGLEFLMKVIGAR